MSAGRKLGKLWSTLGNVCEQIAQLETDMPREHVIIRLLEAQANAMQAAVEGLTTDGRIEPEGER